jgi:hypothetical protein
MEETINKKNNLPLVIGDQWLKKIGVSHVDIIKCDIQGYEKLALLGLKHTLEKNRPIIVMELNLGLEDSFQSLDDFYATFPPNYEVLFFCVREPVTGHYELCQYDMLTFGKKQFGKKQYFDIVVYPTEKKRLISWENKRNKS